MCGIAGLWSPGVTAGELEQTVRRMTARIQHRGPDADGVWLAPTGDLALGHRRLAIVDLTDSGRQPMHSRSGRYSIVFNGEIYNFRRLATELAAAGHRFDGSSDTEVMLAAFEEWGLAAVDRFVGMFAFALWDAPERTLHLVRDRFGKKPLYVAQLPAGVAFASELKALACAPGFDRTLDCEALADYFALGYVSGARSVYGACRRVLPGEIVTLSRDGDGFARRHRRYWTPGEAARCRPESRAREAELLDELDALLTDAVALRMISDVPLGAFLSGGIDSSIVVAKMREVAPGQVRTFSVSFADPRYDESAHAAEVAKRLGTQHETIRLDPRDALQLIPRLPSIYDEPFADSSQIPTWLVASATRRHVTVALSGDGGDEVFGGYNRYLAAESLWAASRWPPALRRGGARLALAVPPAGWNALGNAGFALFRRQAPHGGLGSAVHKLARVIAEPSAAAMYHALLRQGVDPDWLETGFPAPRFPAFPASDSGSLVAGMMRADAEGYLPDDVLVKVDRATMDVALEARAPLLDHRLYEFAVRVPPEVHLRDGRGKRLLRGLLARVLPSELFDRPKAGFAIPLAAWLRGPLRPWAEDLLSPAALAAAEVFAPAAVRRAWTAHLAGRRDASGPLWTVLMFQSWRLAWLVPRQTSH